MGNNNQPEKDLLDGVSTNPSDSDLILQFDDLLPGDVLLYRPSKPNIVQQSISAATNSPYTHATIYLGDGSIADSMPPNGVAKRPLLDTLQGYRCILVLRSQSGFSDDRKRKLREFVASVRENNKFYDLIGVARFEKRSSDYFSNQLEFIRRNFGISKSHEEFAKQSFFCSAFVVACYAVVGIVDETAQVAYQPEYFSPGHLYSDPTFGWILGYLLPEGGTIPSDDPPLQISTWWRDLE